MCRSRKSLAGKKNWMQPCANRLKLNSIVGRVKQNHGAMMTYTDEVVTHITERCKDPDSGGRMIDNIITALTGPIGRGLAVLALVGSGVMMFFGRLNWPIFVAVFVGVVMIFSAETIIDGFAVSG